MHRVALVLVALWPSLALGAVSDARPVPIRAAAYRLTFPITDNSGALVSGASALATQVSKDGAAMTSGAAPVEVASSGLYTLDLTADEMTASTVAVIVTTSSAPSTEIVIYPSTATGEQLPVAVASYSAGQDPWSKSLSGYTSPAAGAFLYTFGTRLSSATLKVTSAVADAGSPITLYRNRDYLVADGKQLAFECPATLCPDLAGGAVMLTAGRGASSLSLTATVTAPSDDPRLFFFEATAAQTVALAPGVYDYDLRLTLSNGDKLTPIVGKLSAITPSSP